MPDETLQNLNVLLSAMSKDHLGKADAFKVFKKLLAMVKQIQEQNQREVASIKNALEVFNNKLKDDTGNDIKGLKAEVNRLVTEKLKNVDILHQGKMGELDDRMASIRDGKDADEDRIIKRVGKDLLKNIPSVKKILKGVKKEKVRDALERLEGEERLKIESIDGLKELLEELRQLPLGRKGGGFSYIAMDRHIIDPYTPTGTQNGTNKDFGLTRTPNPPESLQVFRGGALQSLTEDYTLSDKTVSFLVAPAAGEILKVTHRI